MSENKESGLNAKINALQAKIEAKKGKTSKSTPSAEIVNFPIISEECRAVCNCLSRSALFAAIQSKDRKFLKDCEIESTPDWTILFSGEQLNQDDHDTLMQLVFMARHEEAGKPVTAAAHTILKAMGRDTGGKAHQTLKAEITRLFEASVKIRSKRFDYMGHLIEEAFQDNETKHWTYRINPRLVKLFNLNNHTLINHKQRKQLKRKDLARWLQLELATHAKPFPRSVTYYRDKSGSQAKELWKFRERICGALEDLKTNGDISAWEIDTNDIVHIDRKPSASQNRHITKRTRKPKK